MTIQQRLVDDVAVIQIGGRVTLTDGTAAFDNTLRRLIDEGHVKMILDFRDVSYIDSTALGMVLRAHASVTRRGGALRLLHVGDNVRHILEVTRLVVVLDVFDSEAQALASLAAIRPPSV